MSIKHNEPKFTDPATMACRGAVEHRATWMALLYEQAKEQGADAEIGGARQRLVVKPDLHAALRTPGSSGNAAALCAASCRTRLR